VAQFVGNFASWRTASPASQLTALAMFAGVRDRYSRRRWWPHWIPPGALTAEDLMLRIPKP
jgi:hypothetical protein